MCSNILLVLFASIVAIVLSEDINNDLKLRNHSQVVFPLDTTKPPNNENVVNVESAVDTESEENPTPRESKGIKYYSIHNQNDQSRNANPVKDNYENDDYNEGLIGEIDDVDDDYDYKSIARNEPKNQLTNNRNRSQINGNHQGSPIVTNTNMKKSNSDNPRIISLRDGFNMFRDFWRNRNVDKNKEVMPIITLTTTPTTAAMTTMAQEPNNDFGTPTGTATGTGTMTAASADEIEQNNAAESAEPQSPFFSFQRNQPVQYEIIEEDPEVDDSNLLALNGDYIDITSDELHPEDEGKSSIAKISPPVIQKIDKQNQQTQLHEATLLKRKNTKLPVKVLDEPTVEIKSIEKPKVTQEIQKTGLEYYRQYLPNLQKLIEIRPKFFVNGMFPASKTEMNNIGTQRNLPQGKSASRRRNNQRITKRKKPAPKFVGFVNTDQPSKTNRLPVQRVALYLV